MPTEAAMTHDEFHRQYEDYPWDPYQPLAVFLSDGRRVYIDTPEQVRLTPDELVITRRTDPRHPERYRYADISRLVPLLELPADPGGMSYAEFDPLVRGLILREPFQPFVVELRTGEKIEVNRPGPRSGRFMVILGEPHEPFRSVAFDDVARLTPRAEMATA